MTTVEQQPGFPGQTDLRFRHQEPKVLQSPRVLVVEDDEVARELLVRQIRRFDPSLLVLTAANTDEAAQIMASHPPDLLIADYYLEGDQTAVDLLRAAEKNSRPVTDALVISTGAPLPALFAAEREGLRIKFVKKPVDRFLLYRFLQFDLDRGYYL